MGIFRRDKGAKMGSKQKQSPPEPKPGDAAADPQAAAPPPAPPDATPAVDLAEPPPPDASLEHKRAYLVEQGVIGTEEAAEFDLAQLDQLIMGLVNGTIAPRPPAPTDAALSQETGKRKGGPSDAELVEQELAHLPREGLIALVTDRGAMSVPAAAQLSTTELRTQARHILVDKLAHRRAAATLRKASPPSSPPPEDVPVPYGGNAPQHYVVRNTVSFMQGGQLVTIRVGDLVNETTHDIESLRRSGAQLLKCEAPPAYVSTS